ncbi:ribosomal protein S18 [Gorgonomyces haynaldii]|nr:ribosomal protein S18 [Gorgonomyces haynaldii]
MNRGQQFMKRVQVQLPFKLKQQYHPREFNLEQQPTVPAKFDVLKQLRIDPLKHYKNTALLSHFLTTMGQIKPRRETGLTLESQKRISKIVKRGRAMGLIPYTFKLQ